MAVPSSGQLTMVGIFSEKNEDDYSAMTQEENNISLRGLSSNSLMIVTGKRHFSTPLFLILVD